MPVHTLQIPGVELGSETRTFNSMIYTCFRLYLYPLQGICPFQEGKLINREEGFKLEMATYMEDMHVLTFLIEMINKALSS